MYKWRKTAKKVIKLFVLVVLPWAINYFTVNYPAYANLTLSTILWTSYDYLKHGMGYKLP